MFLRQGEQNMRDLLRTAANVRPNGKQLNMLRNNNFYAFVHFGVNTFTDMEWGTGKESPEIFNPAKLDCDQWVEAVKSAGMTGIVLTAKHHDGFCLWPSKYTEHSVRNSPFRNGKCDVVKECADACAKGGIKFGFYLSPWDRNAPTYGTDAYNDYFKAQLTELLTQYGEIFYVWFDGACGEGSNGKKQVYDFDGYIELINKYQPNAAIFSDFGPDIRWCGNEQGSSRYAEWAVVPYELCHRNKEVHWIDSPIQGDLSYMYNCDQNIGSLSNIMYSKGLVFCPSEVDMSIRKGWFYHKEEEPHFLDKLFDTYIRSVGGNCTFNLNIPPTPDGRFDERDVKRLKELGEKIRNTFSNNLAKNAKIQRVDKNADKSQCEYIIKLPAKQKISYVVIKEEIEKGQRIEGFQIIDGSFANNKISIYEGTTVGNMKICPVKTQTDTLILRIISARSEALIKSIELYA